MKSLRSTGRAVAARAAVRIFGLALERRRIGQHREARRAARLIGARERRRIEVGADQPFRRARLLDLGDQRVVAGRELALDRREEAARRQGRPWRLPRSRPAGARASRPRSPRACRLRSWRGCRPSITRWKPRSADRAGLRPRAESSDLVATATPSFRSFALPATTMAAAAFSSATSRNGPFLPLSTSFSAAALVSASPPRNCSGLAGVEADILRLDLERRHLAVFQRRDRGRPRGRDLVEPVRAVHHIGALAAQVLQHIARAARPTGARTRRPSAASRRPDWRAARAG